MKLSRHELLVESRFADRCDRLTERLRLEAARLMIEQSRHPVEVIAAETGFGDQERMRRAFLRAFGRPPQTLRRMALNKTNRVAN
jgi:transcriptional regulator GlxA family with amidase domain